MRTIAGLLALLTVLAVAAPAARALEGLPDGDGRPSPKDAC